jgi:hypothetical protein
MTELRPEIQTALDQTVEALVSRLGDNLYSCILYGSVVRGDFVPIASDVNMLFILNESTPEAHETIAEVIQGSLLIDPFIIGRAGMERSFRSFALKFLSIRRDYQVLHGEDPLADLKIDADYERFICEQSLRNVRLRLVRAFVVLGQDKKRYAQFIIHWIPTLFIDLSAALRLTGTEIPKDFSERIPVIESGFDADASILWDLLTLKKEPVPLSSQQVMDFHSRVFHLLTCAIQWMESRWPTHALAEHG